MKPSIRRIWYTARLPLQITGACCVAVFAIAACIFGALRFVQWLAH